MSAAGAEGPAPLLSIDGLTVAAGARALLRVTRFSVSPGEVAGLVGETGSGKTLTALSVVGLFPTAEMRVTGGSVAFAGEELVGHPERVRALRGRRVGMVFQDPQSSLTPVFPVGEPLVRLLMLHGGLRRGAARMEAARRLREVELADADRLMARYPHELSGGQRQRVAVALALAARPALVLADEPTTALDVTVQAEVVRLLVDRCRGEDAALLFISHNLALVAHVADRVAVMYAGDVVEWGEARALIETPAHPYTRALIAAVPKVGRAMAAPAGDTPEAIARADCGPGCPYAPRCPLADARCRMEEPALAAMADGRLVACWHAGEGSA